MYREGLERIKEQGGKILAGGEVLEGPGNYVKPTLVEIDAKAAILQEELFVPILYLIRFDTLEEAIELNNDVP